MEDAANPATIEKKRNKRADYDTARRIVLQTLMSNRQGRMYVWEELSLMNVFAQTLAFGRDGHISTAFAEGRRSLGLRLLNDVTRLCPDEYLLMTKENAAHYQVPAEVEASDEHPAE